MSPRSTAMERIEKLRVQLAEETQKLRDKAIHAAETAVEKANAKVESKSKRVVRLTEAQARSTEMLREAEADLAEAREEQAAARDELEQLLDGDDFTELDAVSEDDGNDTTVDA